MTIPRPEDTKAKEIKTMTLYDRALRTLLASRFEARADDLNRKLTDGRKDNIDGED